MTVKITLTTVGADTGPFDLFSDQDNYAVPFATGVTAAALTAGYTSAAAYNVTTIVKVKSKGLCPTELNITLVPFTTTTTTTL